MPGGEIKKLEYCSLQAKGCDKISQVMKDMGEAKDELKSQGETMVRIDQKITGMSEDIVEIKGYLKGNGREGLCDRVTRVEGKTKFNTWFALLIIGGIVTALIITGFSFLSKAGS